MKTPEPSAVSDQPSAPSLNAFFDDRAEPAPSQSSYDFFGNSELLITQS